MRIAEPIEASGSFWLPSDEDNKFAGMLRISDSGYITVDIQGSPLPDTLRADVVRLLGEVESLGGVTLEDCRYESWSFSSLEKCTLSVRYALRGVHYEEGESATFSRLTFSVDGLSEWLSISAFTLDWNSSDLDKPWTISYQRPAPVHVGTFDDITMEFVFSIRGPTLRQTITKVSIEQTAHVSLESIEPVGLEDMMSLAFKLRNFFRFATSKPVSIHSVEAQTDEITREVNGAKHRIPIPVYGESPHHSETIPNLDSVPMLFRHTDMTNDLAMIVSRWLDSYKRYRPTLDLYFASVFGLPAYLEIRFLSLTQVLEGLHRAGDGSRMSLKQRIEQLMGPFTQYFGNEIARDAFVDKVVKTRNYLTHYDDALRGVAAVGPEMSYLCNRLDGLFQLNLLKAIGFSDESIEAVLREHGPLSDKLGLHVQGWDSDFG